MCCNVSPHIVMAFWKIPKFLGSGASWSSPKADYFGNGGAVWACVCGGRRRWGAGVQLYLEAHFSPGTVCRISRKQKLIKHLKTL